MYNHHATVCIGDSLENVGLPDDYKTPSSDTSHIICERFAIDDVRTLVKAATQKPISQTHRVFVIVTKKLPIESQNALLKLFEDPPAEAKFFLIIPQAGMLIPTLHSRVFLIDAPTDNTDTTSFDDFRKKTYPQRFAYIEKIIDDEDVQAVQDLLYAAERFVARSPQTYTDILARIIYIQKYIRTQGASTKMLLEDLALTVPEAQKEY